MRIRTEITVDHDQLIGEVKRRFHRSWRIAIDTTVSVAATRLTGEPVGWEWSVVVNVAPRVRPYDESRYVFGGETATLAGAVAATHRIVDALADDAGGVS